ncbi:penicillin-binding transpeptidase domain-containing protein [Nakamurella lactea]|uniref:penicillin-binding transpeptidase domain-containing protein n=1 Tax=Nakamurella lactea TaxID=459515 RepID=UPI0012B5D5FF|nr:penicillin-binding transpeptidase domain-containing protein [Nakamurella lactea]
MVLMLAVIAGCTPGSGAEKSPDPQTELDQFITYLQSAEWDKAAALTSDPGSAGQMLHAVLTDLNPTDLQIAPKAWNRTDDATAEIPVSYSWQLPDAGIWTYDATWNWRLIGSGEKARWSLDWSPTVLHPELGAQQTLAVRTTDADPGTLVDRNNRQILSPVTVYAVQANRTKITDPTATANRLVSMLKKFDPTLQAAAIVDGIKKSDASIGYTVINLRENEFTTVQQQLATIPGLSFPSQVRSLGPTKDFARTVLSQVEPVAEQLGAGKAGWRIVSVDSTGAEVKTLTEKAPTAGAKVILTLDIGMQEAAEKALSAVKEPATLVAIQPSTGEILAVAQNAAANAQGSIALTGRYPPGSIFKIVTATAAIDHKLATPTTVVPCPGEWTINSRPVHNEGFELGDVPMRLAFAKSCNTTFAQLASQLPKDALSETAEQYGIGLDFVIPGITTLTGKIPVADSTVQLAEDGFGQGLDLVTPFSAALMAATAATGNMPMPTLIRGQKTTVDRPAPARSAAARSGLTTMMRAVVTEGTATLLQSVGTSANPVSAKTGTAEFSDDKGDIHAHAWTVGSRGDVAFSALIVGGDSSKRTNEVLKDFLAAVPAK